MKKKIMILSILIILSILLIIAIFLDKNKYMPNQAEINKVSISSVKKEIINNEDKKDDTKSSFEEKYQWQLSIPKISLNAPIKEGSDNNTLKSFVGHIEGTGTNGSIYLSILFGTFSFIYANSFSFPPAHFIIGFIFYLLYFYIIYYIIFIYFLLIVSNCV